MARADFEVVGIVGRGHLQCSGAGGQVHVGIPNDGNLPVHQRQDHCRSGQVCVAFVVGVDGHGRVAQHGFRACGGHGDRTAAVGIRVADMVEMAVEVLVLHFEIGEGRMAATAPVDDVVALVYQSIFVKLNKDFSHRLGETFIHGEPLAVPVAGGSQPF